MATNWVNRGHDERQTFCSPDGTLADSLTSLWRYTSGGTATGTAFLAADGTGVYSNYLGSFGFAGGTTEKINYSGTRLWRNSTWAQGGPEPTAAAPTLTPDGGLIISSDGMRKLSATTGALVASATYDIWGETIIDPSGTKMYMSNNYTNGDTPSTWGVSVFPSPLGLSNSVSWRALWYYTTRSSLCPVSLNTYIIPSMVCANSSLYVGYKFIQQCVNFAYDSNGQPSGYKKENTGHVEYPTGIYVFDTATGTQKGYIPSDGWGAKLAVGTYLFSAETSADLLSVNVKAYDLDTLSLIWSATISEGVAYDNHPEGFNHHVQYHPYPMIIGNLVVVPTETKITAYNKTNGSVVWTYTQPAPYTADANLIVHGSFMAGAGATNTIVLCQNSTSLVLLDATNGSELWSGTPTGATVSLINPIIIGDKVFVTDAVFPSGAGAVYCLQSGTSVPPPTDTTAPTVSITTPTDGSTVSDTITITASSSDDIAVARLDFYINGLLKGTISYPPTIASISFNTNDFVNGTYSMYCIASDVAGNSTRSADVGITIDNTPPVLDTTGPEVTVTASSTVPKKGSYSVTVNASDPSGVSLINIYIDTINIGQCSGVNRCSKNYPVGKISTGNHTLTVKVKDSLGNQTIVTKPITK